MCFKLVELVEGVSAFTADGFNVAAFNTHTDSGEWEMEDFCGLLLVYCTLYCTHAWLSGLAVPFTVPISA